MGNKDFSLVEFGGSGGAAGSHNNYGRDGSKGGESGGIIFIFSQSRVSVEEQIDARGMSGEDGYLLCRSQWEVVVVVEVEEQS